MNPTDPSSIAEPSKPGLLQTYPPWVHRMLKGLSERRRERVVGFVRELELGSAKPATVLLYLHAIRTLGYDGKPYDELTREDLIDWQFSLQRGDLPVLNNNHISQTTFNLVKRFVKRFLRYCHNGSLTDRSTPHAIDCIRYRKHTPDFQREILTQDEIRRMVDVCSDQRDRALIFVAYESGTRAGELLSLRIRDVHLDQYGAVIVVKGKTGPRRIRLVQSAPDLQLWVNMHPYRDDPDAPLWLSHKEKRQGIKRHHLCDLIKERAKQAGLKKRVYPHLLRHSRATHLANVLTEAQMREFFGWTRRSQIPAIYVHLSGRDVDRAILEHHGIKPESKRVVEEVLKPIECPRCHRRNPPGAKFCAGDGMPLDDRAAQEIDNRLRHAETVQELLVQYLCQHAPEILEKALKQPEVKQELAKVMESGGE